MTENNIEEEKSISNLLPKDILSEMDIDTPGTQEISYNNDEEDDDNPLDSFPLRSSKPPSSLGGNNLRNTMMSFHPRKRIDSDNSESSNSLLRSSGPSNLSNSLPFNNQQRQRFLGENIQQSSFINPSNQMNLRGSGNLMRGNSNMNFPINPQPFELHLYLEYKI